MSQTEYNPGGAYQPQEGYEQNQYQQGYQQQDAQNAYTQQGAYNQQNAYNQQGYYQQQGYQQQGYQQQGYQQYQQPGYQQPGFCPRPYVETTVNNAFNCGPEGKCRGVYSILALIGGSIGLHYFYINKVGAAILTIVLVMITCGAFAIIPAIQGILGFWTLTNEDFDRRFVNTNNFWPFF